MKKLLLTLVTLSAVILLTACGSKKAAHDYTIGVASNSAEEAWKLVAKNVKKDGITLKVKLFDGYTEENPALADGSLDLNAFQHVAYLENYNKENNQDLQAIGYTLVSPFGLYSDNIKDYKELKDGDKVAIPNDPTNGGRALQLLQAIGILTLKKDAPSSPTLKDIESYQTKIKIVEVQADQIAPALKDFAAATINSQFVVDQLHTTPKKAALYIDTDHLDKVADQYKNVVAVRKADKDNADFKKIVKAYQTPEVAKIIEASTDYPAWDNK